MSYFDRVSVSNLANPHPIKVTDGTYTAEVDRYGYLPVLDIVHHKIHEGEYFEATHFYSAVADTASADLLLYVSGDKEAHIFPTISAGGSANIYIYESPTINALGTTVPSYNLNRIVPETTNMLVYHTPTISGVGTLCREGFIIGSITKGETITPEGLREMILDLGKWYLIRATNVSGNAQAMGIQINWYEHASPYASSSSSSTVGKSTSSFSSSSSSSSTVAKSTSSKSSSSSSKSTTSVSSASTTSVSSLSSSSSSSSTVNKSTSSASTTSVSSASTTSVSSLSTTSVSSASSQLLSTSSVAMPSSSSSSSSSSLGVTSSSSSLGLTSSSSSLVDNTVLLLHMNGTDGSTTFTDATGRHTMTAGGNGQIDTAIKKFGTGSGMFTANTDYVSSGDSDDWDFGTGNFTIDYWVYLATEDANSRDIFEIGNYNTNTGVLIEGSNGGYYVYLNGGSAVCNSTSGIGSAGWHHMALVRSGTALKLYVDGSSVANATNSTNIQSSAGIKIGRGTYASLALNGYIDEFRIVKGTAVWTSNFTPPTSEYSPA